MFGCVETFLDGRLDMCVDMCVGMHLDMCVDMHLDMCVDMCVDTCLDTSRLTPTRSCLPSRIHLGYVYAISQLHSAVF